MRIMVGWLTYVFVKIHTIVNTKYDISKCPVPQGIMSWYLEPELGQFRKYFVSRMKKLHKKKIQDNFLRFLKIFIIFHDFFLEKHAT